MGKSMLYGEVGNGLGGIQSTFQLPPDGVESPGTQVTGWRQLKLASEQAFEGALANAGVRADLAHSQWPSKVRFDVFDCSSQHLALLATVVAVRFGRWCIARYRLL